MNDGIPNFLHVLFSPYMVYHDWSHIFRNVWIGFCSGVMDDCRDGQVRVHPGLHPHHWLPPHVAAVHQHGHIPEVCPHVN